MFTDGMLTSSRDYPDAVEERVELEMRSRPRTLSYTQAMEMGLKGAEFDQEGAGAEGGDVGMFDSPMGEEEEEECKYCHDKLPFPVSCNVREGGREGRRDQGREGGIKGGKEGSREGGREGRREGGDHGREGGRDRGKEGGREGRRDQGREGRKEGSREGGRERRERDLPHIFLSSGEPEYV